MRALYAVLVTVMLAAPASAHAAAEPPTVPLTPEALRGPDAIFHCGNEFVTAGTSTAIWSFRKADVISVSYNATSSSRNFRVYTEGLGNFYDLPIAMLSTLVDCLD